LAASPASGATPSAWANAADGLWTQAQNWSPATIPNNGPGATYDALIDRAGNPYTVALNAAIGVDSLVLNSTAATLTQTGGTLTVQGLLDVRNGSYLLRGGTLTAATLTGAGSVTLDGSLVGVTIANTVRVTNGAHVTVTGGLTLNGGIISLGGANNSSALSMQESQTLGGIGDIVFDGVSTGPLPTSTLFVGSGASGNTLTIDPGITIRTGLGSGNVGLDTGAPYGQIVNKGLIWAQTDGRSIRLAGKWKNQGVLRVSTGRLELYGSYALADLGTIEHLGGDVVLGGSFDNSGTTLALTPQTGSWTVKAAVTGGTIASSGGARLIAGGGTWTGVQIIGDVQVT
jgi:hypothetical protein